MTRHSLEFKADSSITSLAYYMLHDHLRLKHVKVQVLEEGALLPIMVRPLLEDHCFWKMAHGEESWSVLEGHVLNRREGIANPAPHSNSASNQKSLPGILIRADSLSSGCLEYLPPTKISKTRLWLTLF
jgi:hypothetical protein